MKLYNELAEWWHLFSPHTDYEEEANIYLAIIKKFKNDIVDAVEFGSGGGNNAFYFKQYYKMTLTDLSENMIFESKKLNPELIHIAGDMRSVDLGKTFDLVFIHDAIMYLTTETDLLKVFTNARKHLNPNGLLFIAPDFFRETFKPSTDHGGVNSGEKGIRFLEWTEDFNSGDNVVETEYVYVIRAENNEITILHDRTKEGIFARETWEKLLMEAGFTVNFELMEHSEIEDGSYFAIVCKPINNETI